VQHAVGVERDQRVHVVGRGDPDRFRARERPDVLAHLRRVEDAHGDDIEVWMFQRRGECTPSDGARRPLDHSVAQEHSSGRVCAESYISPSCAR
jgi:hypothetical protein